MDKIADNLRITGKKYMTEEPYFQFTHFPSLPEIYLTEPLKKGYGNLPDWRENKTPLILDSDSDLFHSKFIEDCRKEFGFMSTAILKFDPMTVLNWHQDWKRKCGLNFLLNDTGGKSFTFIREHIDGWNYNMAEIPYRVGYPTLIKTSMEHTVINYHPTNTRYVYTVSFYHDYNTVKEWLLNYQTVDYN
jgi:hypothetical protein